ncbi:hypothetical protein D3C80_1135310 [compost metagenome]
MEKNNSSVLIDIGHNFFVRCAGHHLEAGGLGYISGPLGLYTLTGNHDTRARPIDREKAVVGVTGPRLRLDDLELLGLPRVAQARGPALIKLFKNAAQHLGILQHVDRHGNPTAARQGNVEKGGA